MDPAGDCRSGASGRRSPAARTIATNGTVAVAHSQGEPQSLQGFWGKLFPGQIPASIAYPQPLETDLFELEGHRLEVIETGFTDTADSTCLSDDRVIFAQTGAYLRDFNDAAASTATAEELCDRMVARYPRRANPGAL